MPTINGAPSFAPNGSQRDPDRFGTRDPYT